MDVTDSANEDAGEVFSTDMDNNADEGSSDASNTLVGGTSGDGIPHSLATPPSTPGPIKPHMSLKTVKGQKLLDHEPSTAPAAVEHDEDPDALSTPTRGRRGRDDKRQRLASIDAEKHIQLLLFAGQEHELIASLLDVYLSRRHPAQADLSLHTQALMDFYDLAEKRNAKIQFFDDQLRAGGWKPNAAERAVNDARHEAAEELHANIPEMAQHLGLLQRSSTQAQAWPEGLLERLRPKLESVEVVLKVGVRTWDKDNEKENFFHRQLCEGSCAMCREKLDGPSKASCGHVFCLKCIAPWIYHHGRCPTCSEEVEYEELMVVETRWEGRGTENGKLAMGEEEKNARFARMEARSEKEGRKSKKLLAIRNKEGDL